MKKVIYILIVLSIFLIIFNKYKDNDNFKEEKNTYRVEKNEAIDELCSFFYVD